MLHQLRAQTQRFIAAAARVVDASWSRLTSFGFAAMNDTTPAFNGTAWLVMPSVRPIAICTHGKRYEWRLQEMLT